MNLIEPVGGPIPEVVRHLRERHAMTDHDWIPTEADVDSGEEIHNTQLLHERDAAEFHLRYAVAPSNCLYCNEPGGAA